MARPRALSAEDIDRLPPETLALELLARMPEGQATRRTREIIRVLRDAGLARKGSMVSYDEHVLHDRPELTAALAEAWQRMFLEGLVVDWPPEDPKYTAPGQRDVYMLTRWGRQVRACGSQGQSLLRACRRPGVDLHRDLAPKLRNVVAVGTFEQAALIALRAVEARVRRLTGEPRGGRGECLTGTTRCSTRFRSTTDLWPT